MRALLVAGIATPALALALAGTVTLAQSGGTTHSVVTEGEDFLPYSLTIATGDTVVWTVPGGQAHNVAAVDGAFRSDNLVNGERFAHTFTSTGEFAYLCGIHPSTMTGVVVVAAGTAPLATPGSPAPESTAANTSTPSPAAPVATTTVATPPTSTASPRARATNTVTQSPAAPASATNTPAPPDRATPRQDAEQGKSAGDLGLVVAAAAVGAGLAAAGWLLVRRRTHA